MKPIMTEKAVMKIEMNNTLTFATDKKVGKEEIKKEVEEIFEVKVDKVRTQVRDNKKFAYVKLNKDFLAIDVATKIGLI